MLLWVQFTSQERGEHARLVRKGTALLHLNSCSTEQAEAWETPTQVSKEWVATTKVGTHEGNE